MGGRFIICFVYLFSAQIGYLKYDRFASSLTVLSSSAPIWCTNINSIGYTRLGHVTLSWEYTRKRKRSTRAFETRPSATKHCHNYRHEAKTKINDSINARIIISKVKLLQAITKIRIKRNYLTTLRLQTLWLFFPKSWRILIYRIDREARAKIMQIRRTERGNSKSRLREGNYRDVADRHKIFGWSA